MSGQSLRAIWLISIMDLHPDMRDAIERPSVTLASRMTHLESHVFNVLGLQMHEHEARINSLGEILEEIRAGQPPRAMRKPLGSQPLSHLPIDSEETWQDRRRRRHQEDLDDISAEPTVLHGL